MTDPPLTRPSLLVRLRDATDADAWRQFVELYAPLVYRYARRHRLQDADAADLTQEVLRAVSGAVGRLDYDPARGSFHGWVFTLAHRKLCDFLTRSRRQPRGSGDDATQELLNELPASEEEQWERDYERRLFVWAAERARGEFREATWQAFWQTAVEGRSAPEVAAALGMSVGAVYIAKSRVQARLKGLVQEARAARQNRRADAAPLARTGGLTPRRSPEGMPLMTMTSCPDPAQLLRLLDGELPQAEQAELTRHLDGCPGCQRAVEDLASGGRSWSETAANLSGEQPGEECEPALRRAVDELAGGADGTQANRTAANGPPANADGDLSFLAPSKKPGHLGRLGHYEILEVVGRGGMGVVLKGFDEKLHRVVAVKVLAPLLAASGTARKRFVREAQAAAAVAHDHVVAIHAVEDDGPIPYLVMQFVAGLSLEDRIKAGGPLELKEVLRIGLQTAAGLAAAHAQGLVHRDVKPGNILLENGVQRVKITDFGLARAVDDASLTQSGVIAGTPMFMAPEQARGEAVDQRSDLFSLGSVLYTLCTGRPPFRAESTMAVLKRVCDDAPRPIREVNPDIPDWLAAIVMKLLAKAPAQRFQSAQEVADLLGQHLAHLQHPHLVGRPPSVATTEQPRRKRRRRLALLIAAVPVAAGVLVVVLTGGFGRGKRVVTAGEDKTVRVWDAATGKEIKTLEAHGEGVMNVAFSPDGKLLASGIEDEWKLWDANTLKEVRTVEGRAGWLAFAPDGKSLLGGGHNNSALPDAAHVVKRWDLEGKELASFKLKGKGGWAAYTMSPDGKTLFEVTIHTEDRTLRAYDTTTGAEVPQQGHAGQVWSVAVSPDGKTVASAGKDGTVRVWDATHTPSACGVLPLFPAGTKSLHGVAFTPEGRHLVTANPDGSLYVLRLARPGEVLQLPADAGQ